MFDHLFALFDSAAGIGSISTVEMLIAGIKLTAALATLVDRNPEGKARRLERKATVRDTGRAHVPARISLPRSLLVDD